jgi:hypothetical protein
VTRSGGKFPHSRETTGKIVAILPGFDQEYKHYQYLISKMEEREPGIFAAITGN